MDDSVFQEAGEWYFRDIVGRTIGPFPNEEICRMAQEDFDLYLLTGLLQ